jgi:hypothetical protein
MLNSKGRLGFILPHKFFNAQYGEPLRKMISGGRHLAKIVHFGDRQVFKGATTYICLMFLEKTGLKEFRFEKVEDLDTWQLVQTRDAGHGLGSPGVNQRRYILYISNRIRMEFFRRAYLHPT